MKRHVILSLIVCMTMAAGVCAQDTGPATGMADAAAMGLKDAYAGKFLMGAAGDIPNRYSESEL